MRIYDIIAKKRDGLELTRDEIDFFIKETVKGKIADYQISALLIAIYINGLNDNETYYLTDAMAHSGDMLDLSPLGGVTADKHSTGGVGDKTTLVVAPVVAALGVKVAKMSGRGLGHTGGTVDKLESISGFNVTLPPEKFIEQAKRIGIAVVGQSGNLAPADKIIYSLRNSTATVDSIPLIASSIMSKKLAAGADCIVLDVKVGSGAFMKTQNQALELCRQMVQIGKNAHKKVCALVTNMDVPLGTHIGNTLEVIEAVKILRGELKNDLYYVCVELAANMVMLSLNVSYETSKNTVENCLSNGDAYNKFIEFIGAQGGDIGQIEDTEKMKKAKFNHRIISKQSGYLESCDSEKIGVSSVVLGAGRNKKDDEIDYSAGIIISKKPGDKVEIGNELATLFSDNSASFEEAEKLYLSALSFSEEKPPEHKLIYKVIR